MPENPEISSLNPRLKRLRWLLPLLAFLLVLAHQLLEHAVLFYLPRWQHFATQLLFYGIIGPVLAWWVLGYLGKQVNETETALQALKIAHDDLAETSQKLELLIQVNHRLAEAETEEDLLEVILDLPLEVVPAIGCSLIRFDEHQRPIMAIHRGDLEPDTFEAWTNHLSAPELRPECKHCKQKWAIDSNDCPLLQRSLSRVPVEKVYCLELTRRGRKHAILSIYLSDKNRPTPHEQSLLDAVAGEMSLVLESVQLRSRELSMLRRLQRAPQTEDLHETFSQVLISTIDALGVSGGALFLMDENESELELIAEAGQSLGESLKLVKGLCQGVCDTLTPLIIGHMEQQQESQTNMQSLLVMPLRLKAHVLGGVAFWSEIRDVFTQRQTQLVATVAAQTALLIENHRLFLQVSYQAALAERARLSREIHDGLAQTLGYLKLRTGQILKWVEARDSERASEALDDVRELLSAAYMDAREAIDDLRLNIDPGSMNDWLDQVLSEFQQFSQIDVESSSPPPLALPPEVQSQLQRIVQEALSNIRKYSEASRVRVDWQLDQDWMVLKVIDNGKGFEPQTVPPIAKHGLRIMKERTELMDGEFQILSKLGEGTEVIIRLPVRGSLLNVWRGLTWRSPTSAC